jgi:hypothetical protein
MRTPRRDPDTRQGPLLFHDSVIKITRGSGRSFRSVRLAFRQPHQPIAGDDRAAWRHFHAAQRHQSGQCDRRYFPGGCPKVNFKGYFEQRSKLFRRQNRRSFDHHQMDTLDYQTTPVLRGTAKGGVADGGANLEDQSPPSDRYGDSPNRFH